MSDDYHWAVAGYQPETCLSAKDTAGRTLPHAVHSACVVINRGMVDMLAEDNAHYAGERRG